MSALALSGGSPVRTAPFPRWPVWDRREIDAVVEVVESGSWGGIPGLKGQEFARQLAAAHDAAFGVVVSNGTAALQVGLRAVGVRWGDEVIVPAITWIATPQAALYIGAVPVFCDVDAETLNLDPASFEARITPRTRAVIPVHLGGLPVDLDAVLAVARRHGLAVVEDCAHAQGSQWRGRGCGSFGDLGAFSFQQSKVITAGEGGAIVTNDRRIAELCESLINCGRLQESYEHLTENPFGYNFRLTELQAALLLAQMTRLAELTARREAAARFLDAELGAIPGLLPLRRDDRVTRRAYYVYRIRYDGAAWGRLARDAFVRALRAEGIPAGGDQGFLVYRNPLYAATAETCCALGVHRAPGPLDPSSADCPVAERAMTREVVGLPQNVLLGSPDDLADVVRAVRKLREHAGELR